MKQIDVRFSDQEMADLQSMVGKRMLKYKCDPFCSSHNVYGIVGVRLEDCECAFTNFIEVMDHFGHTDDVALFKINRKPFDQIESCLQEVKMVEYPVNQIIRRIDVVNERQRLYENGMLSYEVLVTRGIIFFFEDASELSFEKNVWFSEDITVMRGVDLIDLFSPTREFEEEWYAVFVGKCDREIITLQ